jgi:hypothetical protein
MGPVIKLLQQRLELTKTDDGQSCSAATGGIEKDHDGLRSAEMTNDSYESSIEVCWVSIYGDVGCCLELLHSSVEL